MVKRGLLIGLGWMACLACDSEKVPDQALQHALIPAPQQITLQEGYWSLEKGFSLTADPFFAAQKTLFEEKGKALNVPMHAPDGQLEVVMQLADAEVMQEEAYRLTIDEAGVRLEAATTAGMNRALASLEQLLRLNRQHNTYFLPYLLIEDAPSFAHRGLLLDCARHFFAPEVIKKYLDLMALFKMNTLHWHLTEDQAWRLPIQKYPRLNTVAAYRSHGDSVYGGYYTREQIQELVEYATVRGITIIPEIELPGHSQAAIAAYPQLSCTGQAVPVANDWGVFKEIYCAGNDSVFVFLEDVLTEVMGLFPSKKIHIGGDEAPKTRWEACAKCQRRMAEEGLRNEEELQAYFIQRIQAFLQAHGRAIIGWDEILEGGLAEGAIVQSWRGMEGGIEAVKHGHQAVMSPTSHAYFDYDLAAIDLQKVYTFDPIPEGLTADEAQLILGGECNMWTEHVPDEATLDAKVFPRMLAMSEVLWTYPQARQFDDFVARLQLFYPVLDALNVAYGEEAIPFTHRMEWKDQQAFLHLLPYAEDIHLMVAKQDGADNKPEAYHAPIPIEQSVVYEVTAQRQGKPYGSAKRIPVAYHQALGASVSYAQPYNSWYTAGGDQALVDGLLGTLDFRDGAWQGFWGQHAEITLALEKPTAIQSVQVNGYQYINSWIVMPKSMQVEVSADGLHWTPMGRVESNWPIEDRNKSIHKLQLTQSCPEVQYIHLVLEQYGKLPPWHEAAGMDSWIFIDEVVVQ
jgi:hexosaminidase